VKWRAECFARARRKTFNPIFRTVGGAAVATKATGTKGLHAYFFTEEASDDYLRMLVVIPQYIRSYTAKREGSVDSYRFVIPRRITQDFLENRYGDIKMKVRHNGVTAANVLPAVHTLEINQVQSTAARGSKRKQNTGVDGAHQGQGEQPVLRSVLSRFVPLEELEVLRRNRQLARDTELNTSGYTAAFKKIKTFSF
jgi:hypothetical protein